MGADPSQLLRMLEPAVRPVGSNAAARPAPRPPIESQTFETLLAEAKATNGMEDNSQVNDSTQPAEPRGPGPLSELARLDAVENHALRDLLAASND